jgi:hypothetical protein
MKNGNELTKTSQERDAPQYSSDSHEDPNKNDNRKYEDTSTRGKDVKEFF